jgi:hypothetical protein
MNAIPYIAIWAVVAVAVLALALYRKILTFHGDDEFIHLTEGEQRLIPQQVALGHKLALIDRWGKSLTVFTAAYGILLVAVVLYEAWRASLVIK